MKKLFRPLVLGGILLLAVGLAPVMDTTPARAATVTDGHLSEVDFCPASGGGGNLGRADFGQYRLIFLCHRVSSLGQGKR